MTCAWDGCDRTDIIARGLCQRDYMRAKRARILSTFAADLRVCPCGAEFATASHGANRFCSEVCRREQKRAARLAAREAARRPCARCGDLLAASARSDAGYCSPACQQAAWYDDNDVRLRAAAAKWKRTNRALANDYEHRRRARMYGNGHERIDFDAVWLRDQGRCWLCDLDVDPALVWPHPQSPTLDHIVPLALGGGHLMSNVALSHARCNISKKDRPPDRLPAWALGGDLDALAS